ncbi:MAG: hypothetical protein QOG43_1721 [Actinomycetota bacterium]|nr:hypothetical protein [Actinomycetota bacterium]
MPAAVAAVAVLVLAGAGACSGGGSGDTVAPASTTTSTSRSASTTVAGPPVTTATTTGGPAATPSTTPGSTGSTAVPGEVTIRATVLTVFASARVLELDPPVSGYSKVALTADTEYRSADGSAGALIDVGEGSTIEVTGTPGSPGTLIARLVVLAG